MLCSNNIFGGLPLMPFLDLMKPLEDRLNLTDQNLAEFATATFNALKTLQNANTKLRLYLLLSFSLHFLIIGVLLWKFI